MFERIKKVLTDEGILQVGAISIAECDIIKPHLLPLDAQSAIIFSIPYRTNTSISTDGFSEYARIYDYHQYCSELFVKILPQLENEEFKFYGFTDHSPINEKLAAAKSGLGCIGKNSLFIDKVYGTYVFIGTIITNFKVNFAPHPVLTCSNCGQCISKCPNNAITLDGIDKNKCLSGISQKKNKTISELELLKKHNIVWGCDICQRCCPHNEIAELSPLTKFKQTRIDRIDKKYLQSLSEEDFNKFPFAYKGRDLIYSNLDFKLFRP